ncbi:MAG: AAA family ATPase [bacterium]|nr:AAA family ATPase [bacterium]
MMDSVTVRRYRCFGEEQAARLAPITLFVGENSTGKTSLAAMLRALWDVTYAERTPDFKESPYDLGGFDEIVNHRGGRAGRADSFEASFDFRVRSLPKSRSRASLATVEVAFAKQWEAPVPVRRRIACDGYWVEQALDSDRNLRIEVGTPRKQWSRVYPETGRRVVGDHSAETLPSMMMFRHLLRSEFRTPGSDDRERDLPELTEQEEEALRSLVANLGRLSVASRRSTRSRRPFAGAPTRSRPRRTYDPVPVMPDAEGDYVPTYLAGLSMRDPAAWERLKDSLEKFGASAGLFDEMKVRLLGRTAVDPFQIQVRKFNGSSKGPWRNLADVGYGVSQVLPVVTEILRTDAPEMMLLQQPEVHLHPSAEAALGSLLCSAVAPRSRPRRQVVLETHSDFIIDRICMEIRDGTRGLAPDDVSIVYFERGGAGVRLHSIKVDSQGRLCDVPPSYREFFLNESVRFLGA